MTKCYVVNEEVLNQNSYYDDKILVVIDDNNYKRTRFSNDDIDLKVYHLSQDIDEIFEAIVEEYQKNTNKELNDDMLYNDIDDMFDFAERYVCYKNLKKYEW